MRIGTTDRILTLKTIFSQNWFRTMLINTFGWPYDIPTKCVLYFETYHFLHFAVTTVVNVINTPQLNKIFRFHIAFLGVLIMSTTGFFFKRTIKFFHHNLPKNDDDDDKNPKPPSPNQSSSKTNKQT